MQDSVQDGLCNYQLFTSKPLDLSLEAIFVTRAALGTQLLSLPCTPATDNNTSYQKEGDCAFYASQVSVFKLLFVMDLRC